jgi:hypothetical protein
VCVNNALENYTPGHLHINIPLTFYPGRESRCISDIPPRNTADVTGGKPIAVLLQSISGVSTINPLVAFYDIHGGMSEVLFFYFVPDTTRDSFSFTIYHDNMIYIISYNIVGIVI